MTNPIPRQTKALTRSGNLIIDPRRLILPIALLALTLIAAGFWLGHSLAPMVGVEGQSPSTTLSGTDRFAIERIGRLSAELQLLQRDLATLNRQMKAQGVLNEELAELDPALVPRPSVQTPAADGQGGPLLPPHGPCLAAALPGQDLPLVLPDSEARAQCLRHALDTLRKRLAEHNASLLAIPTQPPVQQARLGSMFGNRLDPFTGQPAFHAGLDFALPTGAPVLAAGGGHVKFAGVRSGYGKLVVINHGNGLLTRYAHLSRIDVQPKQLVVPGQRIGAVGSTGRSTGPHLHFEVLHKGRFVDPQRLLALSQEEANSDALASPHR